eukprot:COSAG02_NODE_56455_length_285_cov_1.107527_1_plen_88_part_10
MLCCCGFGHRSAFSGAVAPGGGGGEDDAPAAEPATNCTRRRSTRIAAAARSAPSEANCPKANAAMLPAVRLYGYALNASCAVSVSAQG